MICKACREANDLLPVREVIYQYLDGRPQELLSGRDVARKFHGDCKGGTWCDCQHKLPVRSGGADPTLNK